MRPVGIHFSNNNSKRFLLRPLIGSAGKDPAITNAPPQYAKASPAPNQTSRREALLGLSSKIYGKWQVIIIFVISKAIFVSKVKTIQVCVYIGNGGKISG